MQTIIQVFSSSRRSLRDLVVKDRRLEKYHLSVSKEKNTREISRLGEVA